LPDKNPVSDLPSRNGTATRLRRSQMIFLLTIQTKTHLAVGFFFKSGPDKDRTCDLPSRDGTATRLRRSLVVLAGELLLKNKTHAHA